MKFIIVGRTGTGKTEMADALARIGGLKILKTTTTRAPRDDADRKRYNFITPEEADKIGAKYLYTKIGDVEYFCSDKDLQTCDVAILDPDGVQDITALLEDEVIQIIYMHVDPDNDEVNARFETALSKRIKNSDNPEQTRIAISSKRQDENERFLKFEELIFDEVHINGDERLPLQRKLFLDTRFHDRVVSIHDYKNDFNITSLNRMALGLVTIHRQFKNLKTIMEQCVGLGILSSPLPGMITSRDPNTHEEMPKPLESAVYATLHSPMR